MLSKKTLQQIAALLRIPEADLIAAHEAPEEKAIALPTDLLVLTKDEASQRDKNNKDEGVKLGKDLNMKDMKKLAGLEYDGQGSLDPERFVNELTSKAVKDASIEPDKKVSQLSEQVTLLQKQLEEKENAISTVKKSAQEASFNANLLSWMPANRKTDLMADNEFLTLVKANLGFEFDDNGNVTAVKKGDVTLRDDATKNLTDPKTAITQFFAERKWVAEESKPDGRGGGNSNVGGAAKPSKYSEAQKQFEAENPGKTIASQEGQAYLSGLVKENPAFDPRA